MYCLTINIKEFRTLLLSTQWYVIKAPKTFLDISSKKDIDNFMENCDITLETNLDKHKLRII